LRAEENRRKANQVEACRFAIYIHSMLSLPKPSRFWLMAWVVGWLQMTAPSAEVSPTVTRTELRSAVERALPLIARSAAQTLKAKDCFTCHHGAHAAMTLNEAWTRGFRLPRNSLEDQLARAYGEMVEEQPRFEKGFSVSNTTDGPGHALWMLEVTGWEPDHITEGAVAFLLGQQESRGNWQTAPARPPTVGSPFTVTFLAMRALKHYGQPKQVRASLDQAEKWLRNTPADDTEDRVYRLRALHLMGSEPSAREAEANALIAEQHQDGGWGQMSQMGSDAYATGTVLAALVDTGAISTASPIYLAGASYLAREQRTDGSWQVKKRTRSLQPMFESGFPYEEDQFISYSATCWATYALLKAAPVDKRKITTTFVEDSRKTRSRLRAMTKD